MACCLDLPDQYLNKAKFAMSQLLDALSLEIKWVGRVGLSDGGIYYGENISGLAENVLGLKYENSTGEFYQCAKPYKMNSINVEEGDLDWTLLFPFEEDIITYKTTNRQGPSKAVLYRYFDIVAASFFWLADWQYFGQTKRDAHGRLSFSDSLQNRLTGQCLPNVDYYREILAINLSGLGYEVAARTWGGKSMAACITHDIDYLKKWRKGMIYRDLVQRRQAPYRVLRELGEKRDPFKISFDWILAEEEKRSFKATWFIKTGGDGRNDVVYDYKSPWLRDRLEKLQELDHEVGLHGSYFTSDDGNRFSDEYRRLNELIPSINSTRQHYLRFVHGVSNQFYKSEGIVFDSSIAFAEHEGFRTGTCLPHPIYDKENDVATEIIEFPLCVMEATLKTYRQLDIDQSVKVTKKMIDLCGRFNGVAVLLWHNIIKDHDDFPGLDKHFESTLNELDSRDCLVGTFMEVYQSRSAQ